MWLQRDSVQTHIIFSTFLSTSPRCAEGEYGPKLYSLEMPLQVHLLQYPELKGQKSHICDL